MRGIFSKSHADRIRIEVEDVHLVAKIVRVSTAKEHHPVALGISPSGTPGVGNRRAARLSLNVSVTRTNLLISRIRNLKPSKRGRNPTAAGGRLCRSRGRT